MTVRIAQRAQQFLAREAAGLLLAPLLPRGRRHFSDPVCEVILSVNSRFHAQGAECEYLYRIRCPPKTAFLSTASVSDPMHADCTWRSNPESLNIEITLLQPHSHPIGSHTCQE